MLVIGIDPGVHTGLAVYRDGRLSELLTLKALDAMDFVSTAVKLTPGAVMAIFEDARLIGGIGGAQRGSRADIARLRGAGSVQRDCQLWADHLGRINVAYRSISPRDKGAKLDAEQFKALTGWTGRTNEHSRDAAMVAWRLRSGIIAPAVAAPMGGV